MSKIVVLVGSVRKGGNTEMLAEAFAEQAGKHHEVELVSVADYNVHPCIGCNSCYTSTGYRCFQDDDMQQIYARLKQADMLVIASPVYFYGISAQLKAMTDRLHTPMRNDFPIRKLGLILVGAADLPDLFDPIILQYRMLIRFFPAGGYRNGTGARRKRQGRRPRYRRYQAGTGNGRKDLIFRSGQQINFLNNGSPWKGESLISADDNQPGYLPGHIKTRQRTDNLLFRK